MWYEEVQLKFRSDIVCNHFPVFQYLYSNSLHVKIWGKNHNMAQYNGEQYDVRSHAPSYNNSLMMICQIRMKELS